MTYNQLDKLSDLDSIGKCVKPIVSNAGYSSISSKSRHLSNCDFTKIAL
jgi:hypothetical protein